MAKLLKKKQSEIKIDYTKQKKATREQLKETIEKNKMKVPQSVRKEARSQLKAAKKEYKLKKDDFNKNYTEFKKKETLKDTKPFDSEDSQTLKKELDRIVERKKELNKAKLSKNYHKKLYKRSLKGDPTLIRHQLSMEAKIRIKQDVKYQVEQTFHGDDTLGEAVHQLNQASRIKMNMRQSLRVTKQSVKLSGKVLNSAYGVGNRSFNLVRGRGFHRTPAEFSLKTKTTNQIRQAKRRAKAYARFKQNQTMMNLSNVSKGIQKVISQGVKLVFTNPLTWLFLVAFIIMFMIFGAAAGNSQYAIYQEDKDLTDSWVYMTKLDAEHNDESNTFFTPLDDPMFYMNYEFEDYQKDESYALTKKYTNVLDDLWKSLNGEKPDYSLVTMDELMKDKKSQFYLKEDDYIDFREIVEEYGYQTLDIQLGYPFKTDELTITRRYGYEGKQKEAKLFKGIEVQSAEGTEIIAPIDGEISRLTDKKIEITSEKSYRLTLTNVDTKRLKEGMQVLEGDYLGKGQSGSLVINYDMKQEDDIWYSVNPAFYFFKVVYTQQTMLSMDYESQALSPEVISLIPKFKEAMKAIGMPEKFLPVVLAVCMQESAGRVPDVMQASESLNLPPNTLGTDESIKQGVRYLWDAIKLVGLDLVNQDEIYLKTAVQSYNFGISFIGYAKSKGYAYSEQLAVEFQMYMSGGTGLYGDAKYVPHVWRYINSSGGSASNSGDFAYPLPNKLNDISGFDYRYNPVTGAYELHLGLDFPVSFGTPIYASEDAEVMRNSDVGDTYGINVVLKHSKGKWWTRYAHMSRANVSVGQKVKRGQLIGYVGSTGLSSGPHLHYEVMTSMYAGHVDPRPFIK